MSITEHELNCTLTVHEIAHRYPATRAIFQRFGMDTCCGGAVSVEQAARRDGIDADRLCAELRAAAAAA
jgi:regulator of cell morphogenesis and NO signaling